MQQASCNPALAGSFAFFGVVAIASLAICFFRMGENTPEADHREHI
jgi:hypothetical protein